MENLLIDKWLVDCTEQTAFDFLASVIEGL